jgi:eukaryotic-like serine/threonine-protein kinase
MSTNTSSADYRRFEELAEEFAARYRRGERPSLQEYIDRCPDLADEIRELFPALVEVERVKEDQPARPGAAEPAVALPPLGQVGDYRILREVGRGGMGVVYEAEQVSLGRRVALKVLPRQVAQDLKTLARFRREARSAAQLHHTNILPVFEVGKDGEVSYYAMQFIQGQGLERVTLAWRTPQGRCEFTPLYPPFVRGED